MVNNDENGGHITPMLKSARPVLHTISAVWNKGKIQNLLNSANVLT